jgi:hypothetical protein
MYSNRDRNIEKRQRERERERERVKKEVRNVVIETRGQFHKHFMCSFFTSRFTLILLAQDLGRTA